MFSSLLTLVNPNCSYELTKKLVSPMMKNKTNTPKIMKRSTFHMTYAVRGKTW